MASTTYTNILTRGTEAQLPAISDGKIRFVTDSQKLFIDCGASRIEITDFVKGYTTSQILAIQSPLDKLYLSSDTFTLYYYNQTGTTWEKVFAPHTHVTADITDIATVPFVTVNNIDTTEGLDFGDEDEEEEESLEE